MYSAGVFCALAAWTKQTEVALLPALFGWAWFAHGRRAAFELLASTLATTLIVAAVLACLSDPRAIWLNMVTIPWAHPRVGGWGAAWVECRDFLFYSLVLIVPALAGLLLTRANRDRTRTSIVPLFLLVAAMELPLGIAATIKVGGDRNSMHSVYYLAIAATLGIAQACTLPRWTAVIRGTTLVAGLAVVGLAVRQVRSYGALDMLPKRCLSQEAWTFAREHPEATYFPWDPLATLMADGRMYHFEYGVQDRIFAGIEPTHAQIAKYFPAKMDGVVYPRVDSHQLVLNKYLPEFTQRTTTADWMIYRRPR
jgi:hypothetical protein